MALPVLVTVLLMTAKWTGSHGFGFYEDNGESIDDDKSEFVFNVPSDLSEKMSEGRIKYDVMVGKAATYGQCWQNAMTSLHSGCQYLDDEIQSRLALKFSNCFFAKMGQKTYLCNDDVDIKICLKDIDDRGFNVFTEFFTQTQSVCFFLANQMWQKKTEDTIRHLTESSSRVAKKLTDASVTLDELNQLQRDSIDSQNLLNQEILESRQSIEEFKSSLSEQRSIEMDILSRFIEIKEFVLDEVAKCYTVFFYVIAVLFSYILTTPLRTSSARFPLFSLFAFNGIVERLITSYYVDDFDTNIAGINHSSSVINHKIWLCRRFFVVVATVLLALYAYYYRDYDKINNQLLTEIQKQIKKQSGRIKRIRTLNANEANFHMQPEYSDESDETVVATDSDFSSGSDDTEDTWSVASVATTSTTRSSIGLDVSSTTPDGEVRRASPEVEVKEIQPHMRYNLRSRKEHIQKSPTGETPDEFAQLVHDHAEISKYNRMQLGQSYFQALSYANRPKAFYSSEDE